MGVTCKSYIHIGCGKLNSCGMSFSIYRRSLTQR